MTSQSILHFRPGNQFCTQIEILKTQPNNILKGVIVTSAPELFPFFITLWARADQDAIKAVEPTQMKDGQNKKKQSKRSFNLSPL